MSPNEGKTHYSLASEQWKPDENNVLSRSSRHEENSNGNERGKKRITEVYPGGAVDSCDCETRSIRLVAWLKCTFFRALWSERANAIYIPVTQAPDFRDQKVDWLWCFQHFGASKRRRCQNKMNEMQFFKTFSPHRRKLIRARCSRHHTKREQSNAYGPGAGGGR